MNYEKDLSGKPSLLMLLMDHLSPINDVVFSHDDSKLYTCSLDGYIYEWSLTDRQRVGEYSFRNIPITRLFTTNSSQIVALGEPEIDVVATNRRSTTRGSFHSEALSFSGHSKPHKKQKVKTRQFIAVWQNELHPNPTITELNFIVTSLDVGTLYEIGKKTDFIVFGTHSRDVIFSILPLPSIKTLTTLNTGPKSPTTDNLKQLLQVDTNVDEVSSVKNDFISSGVLDAKYCKIISIHNGPVSQIVISKNGLWVISGGEDGSINVLGTSKKFNASHEVPETVTGESRISMINLEKLRSQNQKLSELEALIEDTIIRKDREMAVMKLNYTKQINELESKLKREVGNRDKIIIQEREEHIKRGKFHKKEIEDLKEKDEKELTQLEINYEKKLAKESLYMDKMKQAYDEYVVHARMDLEEAKKRALDREDEFESQSVSLEKDFDKNKELLLQYCDYVGSRYQEVISNMEDQYEIKITDLNMKLRNASKDNESSLKESKKIAANFAKDIRNLKDELNEKDDQLNKVLGELDWCKEKVSRLEDTVQSATIEIARRSEECGRWEYKAGEQQQHLSELERIRKVLVTQLQMVRKELQPKQEKLALVNKELLDGEREYETMLGALSNKQRNIEFQNERVNLMQRQLRDLRFKLTQKDNLLSRACSLFSEYKTSLQNAFFDRRKYTISNKTLNNNPNNNHNHNHNHSSSFSSSSSSDANIDAEAHNKLGDEIHSGTMVEIMCKNKGMENALERLEKILSNHSKTEKSNVRYVHIIYIYIYNIL